MTCEGDNNTKDDAANNHDQDQNVPRLLRRYDSLDIESNDVHGHHQGHHNQDASWRTTLHLAFMSVGVVYGDIGTSPLYVYASTFPNGIKDKEDIIGVLSLIYYTLTLLPLVKYVFIVLRANDNGNGGIFALYSLVCRSAKVSLLPSQQVEDQEVSNYKLELPTGVSTKVKSALESSEFAKFLLLVVTMLGTSLVIGDGILTPSISVLSAVSGIKAATPAMTEERVVWISVIILFLLFSVQRFGTDKVGCTFAPIILVWFFINSTIGIFNFIKHDKSVIKAVNPAYIVDYFKRNGKEAWISLGGVVLCITGTEALFADLAHFTVRSIQISMSCIVYPTVIFAYTGQSAYLRHHPDHVSDTFFKAIPGPVYWPVFVVAVLAAIIASQAMISGTFSIIQQSLSLGCFPRVKVVHTSTKYQGQVYIPELNYFLMAASICVTLAFRTTERIGNAYGIAVVFAEFLTSSFVVLIMILLWKINIVFVLSYVVIIMTVELTYLSSVLYKFTKGGYLPLAFASFLMMMMFVWNDVYRRKYYYEMARKLSPEKVKEMVSQSNVHRIPGIAIFYSELVHGVPPIFEHYLVNVPALHNIVIFVSFKSLPIGKVPPEERFLFRRALPRELYVFRCIVRYGYTDARNKQESFEGLMLDRLKEYVKEEIWSGGHDQGEAAAGRNKEEVIDQDIGAVDRAARAGVVHLMGQSDVIACQGAGIAKRIMINNVYCFLKRNLRQHHNVFDMPLKRSLKVVLTYEI
ncbi:hypothetical protein Dimus_035049 [Dionaea muscipula]